MQKQMIHRETIHILQKKKQNLSNIERKHISTVITLITVTNTIFKGVFLSIHCKSNFINAITWSMHITMTFPKSTIVLLEFDFMIQSHVNLRREETKPNYAYSLWHIKWNVILVVLPRWRYNEHNYRAE